MQSSSYDAAGRLVNREFGNGVDSTFTYNDWDDQGGRLEQMTSGPETDLDLVHNLAYEYDDVGNITNIVDGAASENLSFGYDALDRLDWVSGAYSDDFAYNSRGNLSLKGGYTLTYPAGSVRPHAVSMMGVNSYSYDADGNMTSRPHDGVDYTLTYDGENRLIGISGTGLSASYTYNGDGNHVISVVVLPSETKTTGYVGDYFEVSLGTPIEPQIPSSPNCGVNYCVFFPLVQGGLRVPAGHAWISYYYAGGQRVAERVQSNQVEQDSALYYLLTDHLGSTTVTLDANGGVHSELRYDAWGETRFTDGGTPTSYRYTGQGLDSYINLYWIGSRWYDPESGRWIQPDVIVPAAVKGVQAWDRFAYVSNSPINLSDPSGHCPWCIVGALVGAAAGYGIQVYNNYQNGVTGSATWTQNISAEPIVGGALIGAGAVIFAPAAVAAVGDVLVGTGVTTGSTALFGAGMSAYGASTALGNAITGAPAVTAAPTLNTPNEIGAWGEQQVGANLPVQIQQVRVPGAGRVYDGHFTNNPQAYLEVKTSTRGTVYATQAIRDQIAADSNVGANLGTAPTWVFVNAQPSRPLVNLMQQNRIPWHQLKVPWE